MLNYWFYFIVTLLSNPIAEYELALQKNTVNNTATIHGLWLNYSYPVEHQFCNNSTLNLTNISELIPEMEINWGSLYESNVEFWNHEWIKHGTCSNLTQYEYFSKGLQLHRELNDTVLNYCMNKGTCYINYDHNYTLIDYQ
jgi:ribonuclease I